MKTIVHRAEDRGFADHGWLQANHSFSFANYYNPQKMSFGALRVLNDDVIAPKMGFGTHPHDNMEIITIPLSGELKHKDSMHNEWLSVFPGEVQIMSAGTGLLHSEINGSDSEHLSLFQIWITPNKQNVKPRYGQKTFKPENRKNVLQTMVTSMDDEHNGSLKIYQDAVISRIDLDEGSHFDYSMRSKNHGVYMMTIFGSGTVNNVTTDARDAVGITDTTNFTLTSNKASSFLFIEVPMQ